MFETSLNFRRRTQRKRKFVGAFKAPTRGPNVQAAGLGAAFAPASFCLLYWPESDRTKQLLTHSSGDKLHRAKRAYNQAEYALHSGMQSYLHTALPSRPAYLSPIYAKRSTRLLGTISQRIGLSCWLKQQQRGVLVQQGKRDPLDADIWDSWQNQEEDWDTEKFTEDELIDILFDVSTYHALASTVLCLAQKMGQSERKKSAPSVWPKSKGQIKCWAWGWETLSKMFFMCKQALTLRSAILLVCQH